MPICGLRNELPSVRTLWPYFEQSCLKATNSLAVVDVDSEEKITFKQLYSRVNKLSRFLLTLLKSKSANPNVEQKPVAVCMPPSVDLIVCLLAILQIKKAYIPIDIDCPASRVSYILKDSKSQFLITKGSHTTLSEFNTNRRNDVFLIDLKEYNQEIQKEMDTPINHASISSCTEIYIILYTSGSTGNPKGARIKQSSILNRLIWDWKTFPYAQDEVICLKTTFTFVDSIVEIFGTLLASHQLIVIPKRITKYPEKLVQVLEKYQIQRLFLVPSLLRSILLHVSRISNPLSQLKLWMCGGEILKPDLLYAFFDTFKNNQTICNFYGTSELTGDTCMIQFKSEEDVNKTVYDNKVPIGDPLSNIKIYLVSNNMKEVSEGEVGEMLVCGFNVADGYVGDAQADKFIDNIWSSEPGFESLYRTGDYARYVKGHLIFEGRIDSQLKIRGHRVDLSEIELTLQRIKEIDKCCVVCYHPGEIDQTLVAAFTSKDTHVMAEHISNEEGLMLPTYMQPKLMQLDEMPLLVNGKVDRQSLLRLFEGKGNNNTLKYIKIDVSNCIEGKEAAAEALIKTLIKVFGPFAPSYIDLNQNFWHIGGNSLNAILAITTYQDAGYNVGITEFLQAETLNDITKYATKIDQKLFNKNYQHQKNKDHDYKFSAINENTIEEAIRMVARSFVTKGYLESLLNIPEDDLYKIVEQILDNPVAQSLSFLVYRKGEKEIAGVAINVDYNQEEHLQYPSKELEYTYEIAVEYEYQVDACLPKEIGKTMYAYFIAVREGTSPAETVSLIRLMEEQNIRVAKENHFEVIFTANLSSVNEHLCESFLSYQTLGSFQINTWTSKDGTRPFKDAPSNQFYNCSALFLENGNE